MPISSDKIVVTGAAGLVGQNLILILRERGFHNLVAIDKKKENIEILRKLNVGLEIVEANLAERGEWEESFRGATMLIQLHAQIGGNIYEEYEENNIRATRHVLDACHKNGVKEIIHISSSVVNSMAIDYYTETKKIQEQLVSNSGLSYTTLRPTLMFGWFDRKHLGWLSRYMKRSLFFPIPGHGRYLRQPLYVRDFCSIIVSCIERGVDNKAYNITGKENIDYIDIIKSIKKATGARANIIRVPYFLFWFLLRLHAVFDRDPPFTTRQLEALVTPDQFEVIAWDKIFNVHPTPFMEAVAQTYAEGDYSSVVLAF